jgi:D-3-phosphoglycerate dehydrogenase
MRELRERAEVSYYDSLPGSEEKLIERIAGFPVAINIRSSVRFTENVFARSPELRMVSIWGTGTDNIDLAAAERHGVAVTNTPGVSAISIAEHALALLLAVARKVPQTDAQVRGGHWPRGGYLQMHGKTLGIIGLGAIGQQLARIAAGIGMRVIAWTMHPNPALGFTLVPLDELLRTSDVVSLHLRLSDQTRGFLGRRELALLKPGAIFINTARGPIVDEQALVDALRERQIASAGLDVFDIEPLPGGHPLAQLDNVVLSPHAAGITPEALEAGLKLCVENVWRYLEGSPQNVVRTAAAAV